MLGPLHWSCKSAAVVVRTVHAQPAQSSLRKTHPQAKPVAGGGRAGGRAGWTCRCLSL